MDSNPVEQNNNMFYDGRDAPSATQTVFYTYH